MYSKSGDDINRSCCSSAARVACLSSRLDLF